MARTHRISRPIDDKGQLEKGGLNAVTCDVELGIF